MLRILAISSQVTYGHVGISAIVPAVHALGHEIIALPSIILSNHPGYPHVTGIRILPEKLEDIAAALDDNGWLTGIDRILTGYLPSAHHVAAVANIIARVKAKSLDVEVVCDPVIGDETEGVYIDIEAAAAIRDQILPLSDIMLPNAFELSWLTDVAIKGEADILRARQAFSSMTVLATSVPTGKPGIMANVFSSSSLDSSSCRFTVCHDVPKGTGDFLSGLIAAGVTFDLATARTSMLAKLSFGKAHLEIAQQHENWLNVEPFPVTSLTAEL